MSAIDQARRYIDAIPSATSGNGGHNQTFSVAMALIEDFGLSAGDARPLMAEYSSRCDPPWSEMEINHKLEDAERKCDQSKRGWRVNKRKGVIYRDPEKMVTPPMAHRAAAVPLVALPKKTVAKRYEISDSFEMPSPIPDGARLFLKAAFEDNEFVGVSPGRFNEEGREVPKDGGATLRSKEWIKKLDERNGDPNKIIKTHEKNGIFVRVNPMKDGGTKDRDVTAYRHVLLEFDKMPSIEEQYALIRDSEIPCTAIILSGGKSVHAWVRVDAVDEKEYSQSAMKIYQHFADHIPDEVNKNPGRFSRLPNCERGTKRQELLSLNVGKKTFSEWLEFIDGAQLGKCLEFSELLSVDTTVDPDCVIGFRDGKTLRYLCRGQSAWLIGPSGIGKSSLVSEFAVGWAQNKPVFGIQPARALKSLIVQAENNFYDLAEMAQGIARGHGISRDDANFSEINSNVKFKTETSCIREEFALRLKKLILRDKPDVVWVDPLLSFAGIAVSKQEECSMLLRQWLNPVLESTRVVLIGVHHTGKPKTTKEMATWTAIDYAYSGIGSSELVNWARAVMVLNPIGDHDFELKLAKRGARANARHPNGEFTTSVFLQHGIDTIRWHQQLPPQADEESEHREKPMSKKEQIAHCNLGTFLSQCPASGEGLREIVRRLTSWLGSEDSPKKSLASSEGTVRAAVGLMLDNEKLKLSEGKYFKGPKA